MRLFKGFIIGLALLALGACTATQQSLQAAADSNILNYTVGKPYAQIAAQNTTSFEGMMGREKAYGNLIHLSQLSNGDRLYRHGQAYAAHSTSTDFLLMGGGSTRYDYRLFYFRVGQDGVIKDYANGVVTAQQVECVNYVGGIFQSCTDTAMLSSDISQMDAQVRTSAGMPLSAWD
ncbi:hypothetical protein [Pelagibacterium limicola]|uniref:hypothetical protein n=1 Tax=Pelagibacterium limicola TaxID=2791022 RepID=UPI0018AF8FBD|nr:hypothetical protein [Pelagibacterium limicola]